MASDLAIAACIVTLRGAGVKITVEEEPNIYATWRLIKHSDRSLVIACRQYALGNDSSWMPPLGRILGLIPCEPSGGDRQLEASGIKIGTDEKGHQLWVDGVEMITIGNRNLENVRFSLGVLVSFEYVTKEKAENALRDFCGVDTSLL